MQPYPTPDPPPLRPSNTGEEGSSHVRDFHQAANLIRKKAVRGTNRDGPGISFRSELIASHSNDIPDERRQRTTQIEREPREGNAPSDVI